MARIGSELTQRMIVNQWVSFQDDLGILSSISQFKNLKDIPDFQKVNNIPVLGYVYVDHDAGISLKVEGLYLPERVPESEMEKISGFIRDSVSLKFRFDVIRMLDIHILDEHERNRLSLPTSPDWLQFYESPELKAIRNNASLDRYRAEGFFDDVFAIIPSKGILFDEVAGDTSEIVWVRLESYSDREGLFKGILLNQPNQKSGLNKNDVVMLFPLKFNGEMILQVGKG